MIRKGFIKNPSKRDTREKRNVSIASKTMFLMGVLIAVFALIYMIVNLERADSIIYIWLPFIIAGVVLVFFSQLIKLISAKKHHD